MDIDLMDKIRLAVVNGVWPGEDSSDDYYDDDDDDDDAYSYDSSPCQLIERNTCCLSRKSYQAYQESNSVFNERTLEADRNAQALLDEEEKEKKKLEKKRAKKRRKRGRMKARKQAEQQQNDQEEADDEDNDSSPVVPPAPEDTKKSKKKKSSKNAESTDNGEDILDINSAFVSAVCLKTGLTPKPVASKENKSTSKKATAAPKQNEPTTRQKLLGEQVASVGCKKASQGCFKEAVNLFTRAIEVLPDDHRFWGNRSFCYLRLGDYKRALEDAEKAITLSPESSKAFYRKAEVLFALKDYAGAEKSFEKVLALDKDCVDAQADLEQVRLALLMDMGFPKTASLMAIAEHSTVQAAVEALTTGDYSHYIDNCDDINYQSNSETVQSNDEDCSYNEASNIPRKPATITPPNPNKQASLWVGSVLSDVTEDILTNLFQKHGVVVSVRLLPEKSCAFVNFKDSKSAGEAMANLQGYSLMGRNILIRYPNKTKEDNHAYQQMVSNQTKIASTSSYYGAGAGFGSNGTGNGTGTGTTTATATATGTSAATGTYAGGDNNSNLTTAYMGNGNPASNFNRPKVKLKGPVNGQECYYWRTSGCAFGVGCRNLHIQENCGIDRKAWHK